MKDFFIEAKIEATKEQLEDVLDITGNISIIADAEGTDQNCYNKAFDNKIICLLIRIFEKSLHKILA